MKSSHVRQGDIAGVELGEEVMNSLLAFEGTRKEDNDILLKLENEWKNKIPPRLLKVMNKIPFLAITQEILILSVLFGVSFSSNVIITPKNPMNLENIDFYQRIYAEFLLLLIFILLNWLLQLYNMSNGLISRKIIIHINEPLLQKLIKVTHHIGVVPIL